jgi:tripartite-type tricarboxylate transporter receptor subunit TctC
MTTIRRSLLVAALAMPAAARAQGFPNRPIRPFAAGGSADASARWLAGPLSAALGQPVVV